jgi:hypothetical protein
MSIPTREARQLTTVAEWPLVVSSLPAKIRQLSPERLKAKIARARTLRTKYADLVKRQHRTAQSKRSGQPNEKLNARTKRKAELFAEVLARYESAANSAKSKKSAKSAKSTKSANRTSAKGRAKQTGSGKVAEAAAASAAQAARVAATTVSPPQKVKETRAPLVPKGDVHKRSGEIRIQAHVSSQGRRRQGRRDSR